MPNFLRNKLHWPALLLLLAGCATPPQEVEKGPWFWPALPDRPRFMFEIDLRAIEDIVPPQESGLKSLVTGGPDRSPLFRKPFGIVARNGKIYVTDTEARQITAIDVPRRKVFNIGYRLEGKLGKPLGLALDEQMNLYVADASGNRVVVYDSLGLYLKTIGGKEDLTHPTGVAVNAAGDRIYVVDSGGLDSENHRVIVYDGDGKKLFVIGKRGSGDGEFNLPTTAAIGPDGTLYVLDTGNFRIQAFDPDGKFLRKWGRAGADPGNFGRPRYIAVDDESNVYISDPTFSNVQIFNSQGELLLFIGTLSPTKDAPGKYGLISGIAVDETGRLYIVDQLFNKIEVIHRLTEEEGIRVQEALRKEPIPRNGKE